MADKRIRVKLSGEDDGTAYIALPGHRVEFGIVAKTVRLDGILDYRGPWVNLDLDRDGRLIGIEILVYDSDL